MRFPAVLPQFRYDRGRAKHRVNTTFRRIWPIAQPDYGSGGWEFESLRAYFSTTPAAQGAPESTGTGECNGRENILLPPGVEGPVQLAPVALRLCRSGRSWTYPGVSFHFALLPVRVAPRQSTLRSPHRRCAAPLAAMPRSRRPTHLRPSYPSRVGGPTMRPAVPASPGSSKLQLLAGVPVAFRAPKCGTLQAEGDGPAECPVWLP